MLLCTTDRSGFPNLLCNLYQNYTTLPYFPQSEMCPSTKAIFHYGSELNGLRDTDMGGKIHVNY